MAAFVAVNLEEGDNTCWKFKVTNSKAGFRIQGSGFREEPQS
jgi:hypothetical protein